jgi:hypothetical protein
MKPISIKRGLITFLIVLAAGSLFIPIRAPFVLGQAYEATPTAGADGRIIYKVQPGDNCISIADKFGLDLNTFRANNNIQGDECRFLIVGRELLIGVVEPPTGTPLPTATFPGPTPTPTKTTGMICVMLYEDINGDALFDVDESPLAGGAISISDRLGTVSLTGESKVEVDAFDDWVPACFENIPQGDYNISVAIPDGYNATTNLNYALELKAGDEAIIDFGAQLSSRGQPVGVEVENRIPLLGVLGGLMVIAGIGLAIWRGFIFVTKRDQPK